MNTNIFARSIKVFFNAKRNQSIFIIINAILTVILVLFTGYFSFSQVTITTNPTPATICSGLSVTLTASGATSYNWSNGLGSDSVLIVSPITTTTYTITGTGGCTSCTASVTVTV